MRMLLGSHTGPLPSDGLDSAYPWPKQRRWVRGLMLMTTEGAAIGPDGRSKSLSGQADQTVMRHIRRYSDAIVIGASTFRAERYGPQHPDETVQAARRAEGLAPAPVVVIVTGSLDLPWQEALFSRSLLRPVIVTTEHADDAALAAARQHAEVIVLSGDRVDPNLLLDALDERGLRRVVCEGGPSLLAQIVTAGQLDELDLTIAPVFTGGGQIGPPAPGDAVRRWQLDHVIEADGYLFARYLAEAANTHQESAASA